ncbi:MAG: Ig-like domain-containing protein [Armatimonadetes bacterium]|nr:Ig-like domain-containing protein [Armatimonadota bacterium]
MVSGGVSSDANPKAAVPGATQLMTQLGQVVGRVFFGLSLVCFVAGAILPQPGWTADAPVVSITHPANGAVVGAEVWVDTVYQSVSGRPIVRLELLVDDQVARTYTLATPKTQGEMSFSYVFQSPAGEAHKLSVRAVDSAGTAGIATISVTVKKVLPPPGRDETPPVVNIYYPRPGERVSGTVEVKVDARDNVGVEWVFFYVDGRIKAMIKGAPPYVDRWDTTKTSDGEHVLQARAWDAAENEGRSTEVRVIVGNREATTLQSGQLPRDEVQAPGAAVPAPTSAVAAPTVAGRGTGGLPESAPPAMSKSTTVIPVPAAVAAPKQPPAQAPTPEFSGAAQTPLLAGAAQPKAGQAAPRTDVVPAVPERSAVPSAERDGPATTGAAVTAPAQAAPLAVGAAPAATRREAPAGVRATQAPTRVAAIPQLVARPTTPSGSQALPAASLAAAPVALAGTTAYAPTGRAAGAAAKPPLSEAPARMASATMAISLPVTSAVMALAPVGARADMSAAGVRAGATRVLHRDIPGMSPVSGREIPPGGDSEAVAHLVGLEPGLVSSAQGAARPAVAGAGSTPKPIAPAARSRESHSPGATEPEVAVAPQAAEVYLVAALPQSSQHMAVGMRTTTPGPRPEGEGRVTVLPLALSRFRDVQVVFDGKLVPLRACPEVVKGIPMGPLREVFAQTDGILYWFPADKRVRGVSPRVTLDLRVGQRDAKVNGEDCLLDLAPYIKQGRTMVPLSFLAEALDLTITFDSERGQLVVKTIAP